jgi:hypothetical protein
MSNLNKYDSDKWAFYINQSKNSTDGLDTGKYTYYASAKDNTGNENLTETWEITITNNTAPNDPSPISLVSIDGTNQTHDDLNCSANITDNDTGDLLNVTLRWYKNAELNSTIDYNNSYVNATLFNAILDSANTTKTDNWTCSLRVHDGTDYSNWINSSNLTILNTLPLVTLTDPPDNNVTTNRTQKFTWSGSDNDTIDTLTYQINISLIGSSTCADPDRDDTGISTESYIPSPYIKCLADNNDYYNWSVRASDDAGATYGPWAVYRLINYTAYLDLVLVNYSVSFGSLTLDESKNTTTNNPWPFLLRNDGNCFQNVSINATDLWNTQSNPSSYYQYKIDNKTGEEGSFNWSDSQTTWQQVPAATQQLAIVKFDWNESTDTAEIDILVTAPSLEGTGDRESSVLFEGVLGE